MAKFERNLSKHNQHACYASSASLAAAHKKAIEQAWASIEAQLMEIVLSGLCGSHGRVHDLEAKLHKEYLCIIEKQR